MAMAERNGEVMMMEIETACWRQEERWNEDGIGNGNEASHNDGIGMKRWDVGRDRDETGVRRRITVGAEMEVIRHRWDRNGYI